MDQPLTEGIDTSPLDTTSLDQPHPFADFRNWLYIVWKHLNLPDPTPVQYDIAEFMQNGPRRLIIEAFRGVGKSFVAGAFVTHQLYLNPQIKCLIVSASKDRADAFSIFVKRLIAEMPMLHHLRPSGDQRDSNIAFDVGPATNDQSPSVKSIGITGQITGSRADILIADDVESLNNSATTDQRAKLGERVREFDAVLKPGGRIIYLGTPQTEFSIYNDLPSRGYTARIWPARYPDERRRNAYGDRLAPFIADRLDDGSGVVGSTTDPLRFSDLDLAEREGGDGRSWFALQYMLDTSLADADRYPLKLADLIVMGVADMAPAKAIWCSTPEFAYDDMPIVGLKGDRVYRPMEILKPFSEFTGCVMAIDPSGRGKDDTGYAIVKIANGLLYLVASGGFQGGYEPDTLKALAVLAKMHKVNVIIPEDNFGDGMFTELLKPVVSKVHLCAIEPIRSKGQKELRIIDTLEPVMNQHRLVVDERVLRSDYQEGKDPKKTLMYQMTRITRDRGSLAHDDRLDALSMAVAYFSAQMARDMDAAAEDVRQALKDQQLKDFVNGLSVLGDLYGTENTGKSWIPESSRRSVTYYPG